MSRVSLYFVLAVALLAICATPAARATSFDLNVNDCSCIPTSLNGVAGTVSVSVANSGTSTSVATIDVNLSSPLQFHENGLDAFDFNVVGFTLTSSNISVTNNGGSTWTFITNSHEDGLGTFQYGLTCTSGANGCVTAPVTELTFTITAANLTAAAIESTNSGTSNTDFGANVANSGINSCTGVVGAGNGTSQSTASGTTTTACSGSPTVPEPSSIAFFATGLLGLGFMLRNKLALGA